LVSFGSFADQWFEQSVAPSLSNDKHKDQWRMTLSVYAKPIRDLPLDAIGVDEVLRVLQPIWNDKPETASRLRGRIERVLDAAKVKGFRSGDNPAAWRGQLALLLPSPEEDGAGPSCGFGL